MEGSLHQKAIKGVKEGLQLLKERGIGIDHPQKIKDAVTHLSSAKVFFIVQHHKECYRYVESHANKVGKKSFMYKAYRSMPFDNMFIECRFDPAESLVPGAFAMHVREDGPKRYDIMYFHSKQQHNPVSMYITLGDDSFELKLQYGKVDDANAQALVDITSVLLHYIESKEVVHGEEKISWYKKTGSRNIKPITYVTRKRTDRDYYNLTQNIVKWSHSWRVCGHWRRIETIGKDRYGSYGVRGFTWVKDHIKGDGDLVEKQRIVK